MHKKGTILHRRRKSHFFLTHPVRCRSLDSTYIIEFLVFFILSVYCLLTTHFFRFCFRSFKKRFCLFLKLFFIFYPFHVFSKKKRYLFSKFSLKEIVPIYQKSCIFLNILYSHGR